MENFNQREAKGLSFVDLKQQTKHFPSFTVNSWSLDHFRGESSFLEGDQPSPRLFARFDSFALEGFQGFKDKREWRGSGKRASPLRDSPGTASLALLSFD